jgi:hypothetical protein
MKMNTVWQSTITTEMVAGWSDDAIAQLMEALDDAVQQTYEQLKG